MFDVITPRIRPVGAGTVRHDDPQLTVRLCNGPNPLRVVIDTSRRLGPDYRVFQDDAAPTYLICAEELAQNERFGAAKVIGLPRAIDGGARPGDQGVSAVALLAELAGRGIARVFVEGGGQRRGWHLGHRQRVRAPPRIDG